MLGNYYWNLSLIKINDELNMLGNSSLHLTPN